MNVDMNDTPDMDIDIDIKLTDTIGNVGDYFDTDAFGLFNQPTGQVIELQEEVVVEGGQEGQHVATCTALAATVPELRSSALATSKAERDEVDGQTILSFTSIEDLEHFTSHEEVVNNPGDHHPVAAASLTKTNDFRMIKGWRYKFNPSSCDPGHRHHQDDHDDDDTDSSSDSICLAVPATEPAPCDEPYDAVISAVYAKFAASAIPVPLPRSTLYKSDDDDDADDDVNNVDVCSASASASASSSPEVHLVDMDCNESFASPVLAAKRSATASIRGPPAQTQTRTDVGESNPIDPVIAEDVDVKEESYHDVYGNRSRD